MASALPREVTQRAWAYHREGPGLVVVVFGSLKSERARLGRLLLLLGRVYLEGAEHLRPPMFRSCIPAFAEAARGALMAATRAHTA